MYRQHLLDQLRRYEVVHPEEGECVRRFAEFVESQPKCFLRACAPGHVTASAWIVSADHRQFLLAHHKKLDRWLQLGGHVDGEPDVVRAALREAQEESGMWQLQLHGAEGRVLPLDVDVHAIPANRFEPAHLHYDVRFLLVAADGERPRASDESHDVRWFPLARLGQVVQEESLLRMGRKARARLTRLT